jgi:hypothetical protein
MWGKPQKASRNSPREPALVSVADKAHPEPQTQLLCCGQPMEPRLAQARDRSGQTMFVAVWRCPRCGRISY